MKNKLHTHRKKKVSMKEADDIKIRHRKYKRSNRIKKRKLTFEKAMLA